MPLIKSKGNPFGGIARGLLLLLIALGPTLPIVHAQVSGGAHAFRWIHQNSDPELWNEIVNSFTDELRPDEKKRGQDDLDVYKYKYLQRVGALNDSAIVIIGHRLTKEINKDTQWNEYHSAFNYNFRTHKKAPIAHAEWMWKWKFSKLATFGPSSIPDVTFTYLTCTECEPETIFASLYYDGTTATWLVRPWGDGKDIWWTASDGLVVDMDISASDTVSFDCVFGTLNLHGSSFEEVAMRCKEFGYVDNGGTRLDDDMVVYSLAGGEFKRRRVTDTSEIVELTAELCKLKSTSLLCRLPAYITVTASQNSALKEMFPKAPKTVRELAPFQTLKRTTSMPEAVRRCGRPDELGGSGIMIFIYHLGDGSLVTIGASSPTSLILYVIHVDASGKSTPLVPWGDG